MNESKTPGQILHETFPIAKEVPWNVLSEANKAQREASAQAVLATFTQPAPQVVELTGEMIAVEHEKESDTYPVGWPGWNNIAKRINAIIHSKAQPATQFPAQDERAVSTSPDNLQVEKGATGSPVLDSLSQPATEAGGEWEEFTGKEALRRGYEKKLPLQYRFKIDSAWRDLPAQFVGEGEEWREATIYRRPRIAPASAKVEGGTPEVDTNEFEAWTGPDSIGRKYNSKVVHASFTRTLERRLRESEANHNDLGIKYLFLEKERDTARAALAAEKAETKAAQIEAIDWQNRFHDLKTELAAEQKAHAAGMPQSVWAAYVEAEGRGELGNMRKVGEFFYMQAARAQGGKAE